MGRLARSVRTLFMLALTVVVAGRPAGRGCCCRGWAARRWSRSSRPASSVSRPLELTDEPPPGNTVMLAANGEVITSFYEENRAPVAANRSPTVMKQAMVAIEDARFYEHARPRRAGHRSARWSPTWRPAGCRRAARPSPSSWSSRPCCRRRTRRDERHAATEQTLGRKLREARLALALEEIYSKDEILTRYLNIVYFGRTPTASSRPPGVLRGGRLALTLTQAALLAGLVQSPADDDPLTNPEGATIRRNQVLTRMADAGLHHAGGGGRGGGRAARPRARLRPRGVAASRPASAPTSATSCRST